MIKGTSARTPDFPVDPVFVDRWSPRAMSLEPMTKEELMTLFEAARWAPSSNNEQPWRFVYALRGTEHWNTFFDFLGDFNKIWCPHAAILLVLLAKKTFPDGTPNRNALSDAGAAWENFALQGSLKGLVVHGMAGYDIEKVRAHFNLRDEYEVVHMIAVGKPADKTVLPERMQKSEHPNARKSVHEFAYEGVFKKQP